MAACAHFDGTLAWYSEIEPAGVQVLNRHHPEARDIGDLTRLDWEQLEKVDVVTAGFPCQPVSHAGRRQGIEDERWIWDDIIKGLRILRPRYILLENVPGLFTASNGDAMASILHGLSSLGGYECRWGTVRASDTGAPHQRARWFCLVTDTTNLGYERGGAAQGRGNGSTNDDFGATYSPGTERRVQEHEALGSAPGPAAELGECDWPITADARSVGREPRPGQLPASGGRSPTQRAGRDAEPRRGVTDATDWGRFTSAIVRWERILGRPAPHPTQDGNLSSSFVEWMMGLKDGWVTGIGLSRSQELRLLGNGVVPQQARLALNLLDQGPVVL